MSITVLQTPNDVVSGFNPQMYVASSTQTAQTNFRFFTKIKDYAGNVIAEFRNIPHPTYNTLIFDPQRTIENYLSYDIDNLINQSYGFKTGVNVFKYYTLVIQEEYSVSGVISGYASASTSAKYPVNAAIDYEDFVVNNLGNRIALNNTRKLSTNQPLRIKLKETDSYELGIIQTTTNSVKYIKIETYGVNGLIQTATINNTFLDVTTPANRFLSILCGPNDLNNSTLTTGTLPLVTSSVIYYRVAMFNSINVQSTEWKEFEIDRKCTRESEYQRLFFLNQIGRFDAFNFTCVSEDNIEVEKSSYKKLLGLIDPVGFTFLSSQRESSVFYSKSIQRFKLKSDYIDTETAYWLKELHQSPLVYWYTGGKFIPVVIETNSYQAKKTIQNKLIQVELTIKMSVDTQRQRL